MTTQKDTETAAVEPEETADTAMPEKKPAAKKTAATKKASTRKAPAKSTKKSKKAEEEVEEERPLTAIEINRKRREAFRDEVNSKGKSGLKFAHEIACLPMHRLRTGSVKLDALTGGGLVRGSIIQFKGPDSSLKTTVALKVAVSAQRQTGEGTFRGAILLVLQEQPNRLWLRRLGLKMPYSKDELAQMPEDIREEMAKRYLDTAVDFLVGGDGPDLLQKILTAVEKNIYDVIVVDSISAMKCEAELKKELDKLAIGKNALMTGQFAMRVLGALNKVYDKDTWEEVPAHVVGRQNLTTIILINQVRNQGIGNTTGKTWLGEASGGHALKHNKHMDLDFKRVEYLHEKMTKSKFGDGMIPDPESRTVGSKAIVTMAKNKFGEPDRSETIKFFFYPEFAPDNFDVMGDIIDLSVRFGAVIAKAAGNYYIGDQHFRGQEKFEAAIRGNPEVAQQLLDLIYQKIDSDSLAKYWD